jgi:hypothetical protein
MIFHRGLAMRISSRITLYTRRVVFHTQDTFLESARSTNPAFLIWSSGMFSDNTSQTSASLSF